MDLAIDQHQGPDHRSDSQRREQDGRRVENRRVRETPTEIEQRSAGRRVESDRRTGEVRRRET